MIDAGLRRLPEKPKQRVKVVPRGVFRVLVAVGALLVVLLPIIVVTLLVRVAIHRGGNHPAPSASLVASTVAVATPATSASVVPVLLDENSKDPDVLLQLAILRLDADKEADALSFVVRALTRQVERRNDERVATVLYRTANSTQKDVSDKTLALLQGTMAAKGAEIQYQLWMDRSVKEALRKRIDRWIHSEPFERTASGAIHVAVKLRLAETCDKKLTLLPTAAKIGGTAVLSYLEELQSTTGCGRDSKLDCYPCLRKDQRLLDAILQIRTRLTTVKP